MYGRTYVTPNRHYKIMLVDGYNVINASLQLKQMAEQDLDQARQKLISPLMEYGKLEKYHIFLVFDAQFTEDKEITEVLQPYFTVVYTDKGETADTWIERMVYEWTVRDRKEVYVVTSDGAEQSMVLGSGGFRIPAPELLRNLKQMKKKIRQELAAPVQMTAKRAELASRIPEDIVAKLDSLRRGKL